MDKAQPSGGWDLRSSRSRDTNKYYIIINFYVWNSRLYW